MEYQNKQKRTYFFYVFAVHFCFLSTFAFSSTPFPMQSNSSPIFWFDVNAFPIDEQNTQLEAYYSVAFSELTFSDTLQNSSASFAFSFLVVNENDSVVFQNVRRKGALAASLQEQQDRDKKIIDQISFLLPPGRYHFSCEMIDENSKRTSRLEGDFMAIQRGEGLSISEPQLAMFISTGSTNKQFLKADRTVYPNPSRRYNYRNAILYIYFEVYNLRPSRQQENNNFYIDYLITDKFGDSLIVTPPTPVAKPGTSAIKMEALDIRGLERGEHILTVNVYDPTVKKSVSKSKMFFISGAPPDATSLPMTEADIKKYRDQIQYLATAEELRIYDSLPPEGKRNFIINFWKEKDQTPETPENEFMNDYFSRLAYAEKNFKGKNGGINSDMGRVFIIYGQPDDIQRHEMSLQSKPYIIWDYYTGKGKQSFYFVDRNRDGIYTLVHSTVLEEIKNYNWMNDEL